MAPKRSAPTQDGPGPSTQGKAAKKTRFVSPSDDPSAFADQIDEALEDKAARKGRVKTEGYDSDSTDDGEGVVRSRRIEDGADDDDDMFAMDDDDEKQKGADQGKKKKQEFMRLGDIEGQEFNDGNDDDGASGEDEPEDEDDAERRKKAGMGFEVSKFNMREEMEEGRFAEDGMYIRSYDPHAMHDRWMEGLDEKEMKKARKSMRKRQKAEREKEKAEAEAGDDNVEEMQKELAGLLRKGESILEALARLGSRAKKQKAAAKKNEHSRAQGAHADPETQAEIDKLTSLASALLTTNVDIYSETYESLLRSIRSRGNVEADWVPPKKEVKYEYRWISEGDGAVFGPFGEAEMREWYGAAYFGPLGENIEVREAGKEWGPWEEVIG